MVISNYRLPQIERPTEESLDDDDAKVLAAFEIVLSGYKKAQKRTRAITKAYNELESLAARILEELKSKERASRGGSLGSENSLSSGRCPRSADVKRDKRPDRESRAGCSIEMIDLTSLFVLPERTEREAEKTLDQPMRDEPIESSTRTRIGDEENEPPSDEQPGRQQSRSSAKIGLAKVIYSVEDVRSTPQRRSRQSTLVFKPVTRRAEFSKSLEKSSLEKSRHRLSDDNLFDEDYRARKKRDTERATSIAMTSGTVEAEAVPSPSDINETARSLFDDEDNFQASPDILNTCAESSALEVVDVDEQQRATSKHHANSSNCPTVDETFFAPAELREGTSRGKPLDRTRAGKRKSSEEEEEEEEVKANNEELEDLALQDINWDVEMTDDDWNSSAERAPNDSFHVPPGKRKKSPEYAYKEKVERNKAKRSKLRGWDCWQCEQYYGNMQLSEEELKKRMDACSRHRGKFNPRYCTPKDFWNPVFPDSTDSSDCSQN